MRRIDRRLACWPPKPVSTCPWPAAGLDPQELTGEERVRFDRALELLADGGGLKALARGEMTLVGTGVCAALLARSWQVRHRYVEEMVTLARAAVEVARDLGRQHPRSLEVTDLQARAWGELANAYRVAGRLGQAGRAFAKAFALLPKGSGDPLLKARLLDLESSLLGTSKDFALALEALTLLANLYRTCGEIQLLAQALVKKALYTCCSGDAVEALWLNRQAMILLDPHLQPDLWVTAKSNHLAFLAAITRAPLTIDPGHESPAAD